MATSGWLPTIMDTPNLEPWDRRQHTSNRSSTLTSTFSIVVYMLLESLRACLLVNPSTQPGSAETEHTWSLSSELTPCSSLDYRTHRILEFSASSSFQESPIICSPTMRIT